MCIAEMLFLLSMFDVADKDLIGLRRFPSLRLTGKRPQLRLILHNPPARIKKVCAGSWSKLCFWLFFSPSFFGGVLGAVTKVNLYGSVPVTFCLSSLPAIGGNELGKKL